MKTFQKRTSLTALLCVLLGAILLLGACTNGGTEGESTTPPPSDNGTAATTTEETVTEAVTEAQKISYTVTVKTEAGNAVQGVRIQACKGELCLAPVMTDANGVATFQLDKTENITEYHVKINKLPTGYTGDTTAEYSFEAGSTSIVITIANPAA